MYNTNKHIIEEMAKRPSRPKMASPFNLKIHTYKSNKHKTNKTPRNKTKTCPKLPNYPNTFGKINEFDCIDTDFGNRLLGNLFRNTKTKTF